jgi:hypothetical protein
MDFIALSRFDRCAVNPHQARRKAVEGTSKAHESICGDA